MVLTATSRAMPIIVAVGHVYLFYCTKERKVDQGVPFSMVTRN